MKNSSVIIGVVIIVFVALLSVIGWFAFKPAPVLIQGQVEATEVKVATKIAGRIVKKHVKLGAQVKAGDMLIELSSPEIDAKMQQVMALGDAANAQSNKAQKGARDEQIAAAHSVYQKAVAASDLAQKTFERVQNLFNEGVIPAQKRDEAETQLRVSKMNEEAAKANYEMALSATRVEDKAAARALVNQAKGAINEVQSYLGETLLASPINGEISQINAEQGELVTPGFPVVHIIDLTDTWVTFHIREDMLSKFTMGAEVTATVPALSGKSISLKVNFIKAEGDFATWRATKASGAFDLKTFEVRAQPVGEVGNLRPGMTVIIDWDNL
ncbi:MAG: efflux RND transporter periplasmic adaptor subunit [Bacteroidales bacterium]|nr:efflux RND transporter periplasmic adaptor subunit [Bacteroidales bacterium]MBN2750783.1 efflux RND transporter periplasmic adaptor subunit [Bacteroidales bacterium]